MPRKSKGFRAKKEKDRQRKQQKRHNEQQSSHSGASQLTAVRIIDNALHSIDPIYDLVGTKDDRIPDDVIMVMLNLMTAQASLESNTIVGHFTPAELIWSAHEGNTIRQIPMDKNHILIHSLTDHWVTSYYDSNRRQLYLYDSLRNNAHVLEVKCQLTAVYGQVYANYIQQVYVKQQGPHPICGAMAVAFAVSIFLGNNPENEDYDFNKLHDHICYCISNAEISGFPLMQPKENLLLQSYFQDQNQKNLEYINKIEVNTVNKHSFESKITIANPKLSVNNRKRKSRSSISDHQKKISKIQDKERKQATRASRSADLIIEQNIKEKQRKQKSRESQSPQTKTTENVKKKNRMRSARESQSPQTKTAENVKDKNRKRSARESQSPQTKTAENVKDKNTKQSARELQSPQTKTAENVKDKNRMRSTRESQSPQTKTAQNLKDKNRKRSARESQSPQTKTAENVKDKNGMRSARELQSPQTKTAENVKDKNRKRSARESQSPQTKTAENVKDKNRKRSARESQSPQTKTAENVKDKNRKRSARESQSPQTKTAENVKDKNRKRSARESQSTQTKTVENVKDKNRMRSARESQSPQTKTAENVKDKNRKRSARESQSPQTKTAENVKDKNRKQSARESQSPQTKTVENVKDKNRKRSARESQSPQTKTVENVKNKNRKQSARKSQSPQTKTVENVKDKNRKRSARESQSPQTKTVENVKDKNRKQTLRQKRKMHVIEESEIITSFKKTISSGPTFVCTCCCRTLYRRSVIQVNRNKYIKIAENILNLCLTNQLPDRKDWICKTCDKKLLKGKMPSQAQANGLQLTDIPDVLKNLGCLEIQLILKIVPFMKIVAMPRGAQHDLHGQVVLVPADLSKVTSSLPRPSNESQIITLALKRRLTDKQQFIRPDIVKNALSVLKQINPHYKDVNIRNDWIDTSIQQNPDFWHATTDNQTDVDKSSSSESKSGIQENSTNNETADVTDSEDEVEADNPIEFLTDLQNSRSVNSDTCIQPVDGPQMKTNEILNLAPAEGQIPVSVTKEPYWEALAFPGLFPTGENTFYRKTERQVKITPKQYINARLLCKDGRFAKSPGYCFATLDWLEREAVKQSISMTTRKQFQEDITVKELRDPNKITKLLSENQLFTTFRNIRGTPQYFKQMHLDMMAKLRQLGPYTFFITGSAAEFHWPEVIQVIAQQYGEQFSDSDIAKMNWQTKRMWLESNPVTAALHIDYIFEQLWGKVILSGLHPVGQVLNYDLRKEMQGRGTAHFHSAIHIYGAPKLDTDPDIDFINFADRYIRCDLPDKNCDPELFNLVSSRQTHHHTGTCKKRKGISCRFGYPRCPTENTIIARVPTDENAKSLKYQSVQILSKMYEAIALYTQSSDIPTLDTILSEIGIDNATYHRALTISSRRTHTVMKRNTSALFINNYNPTILKCLRSNMDIQMITSMWACIAYITSYICKPEKTMSELMKKASKEASDTNIRDKLFSIGNILRKGREVSHHEAIMRVLSIPLRRSNTPVQFISTDYQQDRTRMLKPQHIINNMKDENTDIYLPGIHQKYPARPQ